MTNAITTAAPTLCACECGMTTKSVFAQGHDASLVSKAVMNSVSTAANSEEFATEMAATTQAIAKRFSVALATKYANAASRKWNAKMAREARAEAKMAKKA